mmetsp:Transcript_123820/g.358136  ORF Transcript_123820/g.358136 Transcript_123820/m.358136 type:complete len:297 (+) Transcript_123820:46-936(+)
MGCNASTTHAPHHDGQSGPANARHRQSPQQSSRQQQAFRPQQPQSPTVAPHSPPQINDNMRTAPLVKSLVAIHRGKCTVEEESEGTYFRFIVMATVAGEASVFFRTTSSASSAKLDEPTAAQVSRARFEPGGAQPMRLFLCSRGLRSALEGFGDEDGNEQVVLDLRADSEDETAITVQRSVFKASEDGDGVQLVRQRVKCGEVVRNLEALYGTLPNPRKRTSVVQGQVPSEAEGGDCVICLSKPREVAILHCRHVCLCKHCATMTSSTWSFQCPVCRGRVAKMVGLEDGAAAGDTG